MIEPVQIGPCTLYRGDCLAVLPLLAAGSVDAVVTDPPYGIGYKYASYDDTEANLRTLIDGFVPICRGLAKRVIITPGNTNITKYPPAKWNCAWTWDTTTARGFAGWSQWQPILFYGEDVFAGTRNHDGMLKADRIHFSGGQARIDKSAGGSHSCPKPVEFMCRLVRRFSHQNETVLDPFMGSGTTGVACVKTGRRFVGIELDPTYFEIACRRIEKAVAEAGLFAEAACAS